MRVVVDAARDEARELDALGVQDAERRITRAGQLPGGLQEAVEHRLEVELRDEAAPNLEEAGEAFGIEGIVCAGHAAYCCFTVKSVCWPEL